MRVFLIGGMTQLRAKIKGFLYSFSPTSLWVTRFSTSFVRSFVRSLSLPLRKASLEARDGALGPSPRSLSGGVK